MKEKGYIARIIFEKLAEVGDLALEGMFPKNRIESQLWRKVLGLPQGYKFSRQSFSTILSRLQKQGLVQKTGSRQYAKWSLTQDGKEKLKSQEYSIEFPKPDGIPRLVLYDVPETERKKRGWLRTELVSFDYKQLQKSVWLGYCPLPEKFVKSLESLKLKNKVHILSVSKTGTLQQEV